MKITSFSINVLPTMHKFHNHNEYECHYIIDGEGFIVIEAGDRQESLKKGDFLLIYPGQNHFLKSRDSKTELIQMMWTFEWSRTDREVKQDLENHLESGRIESVKDVMISYFEKMKYLSESSSPLLNTQAGLLLELFLYSLMEENHVGINHNPDDTIQLCLKEMYSCLRTEFSIEAFARKSGIASSQFIRNFKSQFNMTPYRYYQEMKISALITYLNENHVTLDVAAERFGFSDRFHLSKVFKKIKKMSPSKYLK